MPSVTARDADQVRVLSDLSGLVVGAVIDDVEDASDADAFTDALRRYHEDGAPTVPTSWRSAPSAVSGARAAQVLRHLTRDLLKGVSTADREEIATSDVPGEAPPANVRPIEAAAARDVPALELASDGTWKPSGSYLSSKEEIDANTLRRNVPSARSRYPRIARGDPSVLPPAPKR